MKRKQKFKNWLSKNILKIKSILFLLLSVFLIVFILKTRILDMLIPTIIIIIGGFLNFLCVISNDFKMPVKDFPDKEIYFNNTNTHRRLDSNSRFSWFSDKFTLKIKDTFLSFSVGDILIVFGIILYLIVLFVI